MKQTFLFLFIMTGYFSSMGQPPTTFSWTNLHGQDWTTPAVDQVVQGPCHIFAATALAESMWSLLYNNSGDINLSERNSWCDSCAHNNIASTTIYYTLSFMHRHGVVEETCIPYPASTSCPTPKSDQTCAPLCYLGTAPIYSPYSCDRPDCSDNSLPTVRYNVGSFEAVNIGAMTSDQLKIRIMTKGPVALWFHDPSMHGDANHAYLLIGWRNTTEWQFKDSWPDASTMINYKAINLQSLFQNNSSFAAYGILTMNYQTWNASNNTWVTVNPSVPCVDNDHDGHYFWGLGPKPSGCSPCQALEDFDDSNPNIGPLDSSGKPLPPTGTPPAAPGPINQPTSTIFCQNKSYTFKIDPVACAADYAWSYTTTGSNTMSLSPSGTSCVLNANSGPGTFTLSVKAVNTYGQSAATTRYVVIYPSSMQVCASGRSAAEVIVEDEEASSTDGITVHPVPSKGQTIFTYRTERDGDVKLSISDVFGKETVISHEETKAGTHSKTIDVTPLGAGVHLFIMQTAGKIRVKKFVIE